jgi:putative DNA primase/helicase
VNFRTGERRMIRVPTELLDYKQWVLWRRVEMNGRLTKIPISPWSGKAAACDRPRTWSTYRHSCYVLRSYGCDGIGFVFTGADPFCGIDLDQCMTVDGVFTPEALDVIKGLDSYAEISPSGTGAHILIKAKLSGKGRRTSRVEVYDSGRYFTITGKHLSGTPLAIRDRQNELDELTAKVFYSEPVLPKAILTAAATLSDEDLIERAKNSRHGERFWRLWVGDASDYDNDHSRADLALCRMLAFWCSGNGARIDRLFRRSGLMRDKWDRRTGDSAYGILTVRTALDQPEAGSGTKKKDFGFGM